MAETETQLPRNRLSRIGTRRGEIVEVNGGHIVRSTGLKDRHSKVCTAKGTRDRRVRLSAHTAIQFYDVQDRLGYDRPSKAVDWLINKARAAIDELAELPPWNPIQEERENEHVNVNVQELRHGVDDSCDNSFDDNSRSRQGYTESVKSFFSAPTQGSGSAQDLRLSLQSFESSPIFSIPPPSGQTLVGFDHSGWSDHNFQRMVGWNPGGGIPDSVAGAGPLMFSGQFGSMRGPLQSNDTTQSIRAWIDSPQFPVTFDHRSLPVHHHGVPAFQGFSGFRIPARIQGEEEEHDGISNKPSVVPFDSVSRR